MSEVTVTVYCIASLSHFNSYAQIGIANNTKMLGMNIIFNETIKGQI